MEWPHQFLVGVAAHELTNVVIDLPGRRRCPSPSASSIAPSGALIAVACVCVSLRIAGAPPDGLVSSRSTGTAVFCALTKNTATVTLARLAADEGTYDGRAVMTQGIVRQFEDADGDGKVYYLIEDGRPNRVELAPASAAGAYVGQEVDVIGTFHFDDQRGRSITIQRVSVAAAS